MTQNNLLVEISHELEEDKDPQDPRGHLEHSWRPTPRDLALLARRRGSDGISPRWEIEHARIQPAVIIHKVEGRARHETGEESDKARIVQRRRKLLEHPILLVVGQMIRFL